MRRSDDQEPGGAPRPSRRTARPRRCRPDDPAGRGRGLSVPETAALLLVLVALFVFFSIASPFFLNHENLINILQNVAVVGIIACPATLLLISGQFDLSVGSASASPACSWPSPPSRPAPVGWTCRWP